VSLRRNNDSGTGSPGLTCYWDELKTSSPRISTLLHSSAQRCERQGNTWKNSLHTRQYITLNQILSVNSRNTARDWRYFNGTDVHSSILYSFNSLIPWNTQLDSTRSTISNFHISGTNIQLVIVQVSFPGISTSESSHYPRLYLIFSSGEVCICGHSITCSRILHSKDKARSLPYVDIQKLGTRIPSNCFTPLSMKLTCRLIQHDTQPADSRDVRLSTVSLKDSGSVRLFTVANISLVFDTILFSCLFSPKVLHKHLDSNTHRGIPFPWATYFSYVFHLTSVELGRWSETLLVHTIREYSVVEEMANATMSTVRSQSPLLTDDVSKRKIKELFPAGFRRLRQGVVSQ
jgi:hypothetical protein